MYFWVKSGQSAFFFFFILLHKAVIFLGIHKLVFIKGELFTSSGLKYVANPAQVSYYCIACTQAFNLGTGQGYSVIDMIKAFEKASGREVSHTAAA